MNAISDIATLDKKHEAIAAIRRLSPSATEEFLSDFNERQLRAFLERLREVEAYRGMASKEAADRNRTSR